MEKVLRKQSLLSVVDCYLSGELQAQIKLLGKEYRKILQQYYLFTVHLGFLWENVISLPSKVP